MKDVLNNEKLNILNHSCAHLLAHAVKKLYPDAKFWVGPVIEEGFYYDIDLGDKSLTEEDLSQIEKEMKKISKSNKLIKRIELSKEEALEMFKDDIYKIDLIQRMDENDNVISAYKQEDFIDLCRGPHVESTKELKYFKLLKVSGAYWKGDAKNKMLQRIYGICFSNQGDLDSHLKALEEAKSCDHRKICKDLDIFMSHELVGSGLPLWLPNGAFIFHELEEYIKKKEYDLGYEHVYTPCLATSNLYKISGHWDHYREDMFPLMERDGEEFVLRPMNCPHHMLIYKNELHSYKDLPIRIGELAHDFRFESSGAVCGIERVRTFCQNDAHLFVRPDQIEDEFHRVVDLILDVYKDFNITPLSFRLSLRDPENKEKYFPDDEMWEKAESTIRKVLDDIDIDYIEAKGEAAFYGPKLDVQIKTAVGHELSLSTCQLDFLLPERFELNYIDSDGSKKRPVVIHRAILGSIDRFIAYLVEVTKGAFPLWLSPKQINIIPVNNQYHLEYANKIKDMLNEKGFRVSVDSRDEKVSYKMRECAMSKIPYTLILGDKEKEEEIISYRHRSNDETISLNIDEFIKKLNKEIKDKLIN
ncbi:MAG: threonine--tRNA ligase [Tenericutes bacterium]|nr:threonine--tRNA ligase [Mycoplasmatota bacterium]